LENFMSSIAVIGGGITGVTSAYVLAKKGYAVTLFERHRYPGMETSFANGGQLSASNAEVWTHSSTLLKGMKWVFRKDAPLLINPRPGWHKLSWFAEFIASIPRYRDNTIATARLAIAAREHLFSWAEAEGIQFDLRKQGILHIYRDRSSFDHAGEVSKLLAAGGLHREAITPDEMRKVEPALQGNFYGGYYTASDATGTFTNSPSDWRQRTSASGCGPCSPLRSLESVAMEYAPLFALSKMISTKFSTSTPWSSAPALPAVLLRHSSEIA
jgi:D-amino-acid dehydrogenase